MRRRFCWCVVPALAACSFGDDGRVGHGPQLVDEGPDAADVEVDDREVIRAAVPPPPITGGTMTVAPAGDVAIVSDPDRDRIYVVDLETFTVRSTVDVPAGSHPWRSIVDAEGLARVVLRGAGTVLTVDPLEGTVVDELDVCAHPRGIDVEDDGTLLVACATGELLAVPAKRGEPEVVAELGEDLRDVVVAPAGAYVSRFRAAEVVSLTVDREVIRAQNVPAWRNSSPPSADQPDMLVPHTAWRTRVMDDGGWLMLHQAASDRILGANLATGYYGGGGCAAVVQGAVTRALPDGTLVSTGPIAMTTLPVDMAISDDGEFVAIATAGVPGIGGVLVETPLATATRPGPDVEPPCHEPIAIQLPDENAQAIAVAFDAGGRVLVQTREPARVYRLGPYDLESVDALVLSSESRFDTGHEQFHVAPASGITCASCHPEGGDDGHVWRFADFGVRHTPALDVGLAGTEPFHWSGDLGDFSALVDEVFVTRMSAMQPSPERIAALEAWTTGLPAASGREMDEAALRGAELWDQLQCGSCHTGPSLTNNEFAELSAHGPIQVPPLRGVALHPPYMHDGRAATLEDAVRDMIQRTRAADAMPDDDGIADLAAYLRTM